MPELPEVEAVTRSLRPLVRARRIRCVHIFHPIATKPQSPTRLDPRRPANSLSRTDSAKLHKAIVSVLRRALECCLDPAPDFREPQWWFQGLEKILRAYQREGLPCRRCGRAIRRIEQGGRSTYCCLHCQK